MEQDAEELAMDVWKSVKRMIAYSQQHPKQFEAQLPALKEAEAELYQLVFRPGRKAA